MPLGLIGLSTLAGRPPSSVKDFCETDPFGSTINRVVSELQGLHDVCRVLIRGWSFVSSRIELGSYPSEYHRTPKKEEALSMTYAALIARWKF